MEALLTHHDRGGGDLRILAVCTANQCRSPLIEFALRRRATTRGLPWVVTSAGTQAVPELPPHPHVLRLLTGRGEDALGWRSRRLTPEMLDSADLVLVATALHRSQVALLSPRALRRTYPLLQFAALCRRTPGGLPGPVSTTDWDGRLGAVRAALPLEPGTADVADPIGRSLRFFRRTELLVDDAAAAVVGVGPWSDPVDAH